MAKKQTKKPKKPGPKPGLLQLDGNWQDAMKKAVKKPKPKR